MRLWPNTHRSTSPSLSYIRKIYRLCAAVQHQTLCCEGGNHAEMRSLNHYGANTESEPRPKAARPRTLVKKVVESFGVRF